MLGAAAALALAGCGGGPGTQLRVLVMDAQLRQKGEPCAGAEPFGYVHASARYRVLDAHGATVARGKLPEGTATPTFNTAAGGASEQPTNCQMIVPIAVPSRGSFALALSQGAPLRFTLHGGKATVTVR